MSGINDVKLTYDGGWSCLHNIQWASGWIVFLLFCQIAIMMTILDRLNTLIQILQ